VAEPEYLRIFLPADIDPIERGDRIEDPLDRALRKAGRLGRCDGGETGMTVSDRGVEVVGVEVFLSVTDLRRAVPVIRDVLAEADAPAGTLVAHPDSDTILIHFTPTGPAVHPLTELPLKPPSPRLPWAVGEVVGYKLTPDRWVLIHVIDQDHQHLVVHVPEWCGPELLPADEIPDLVRRPPTLYRLNHSILFQTGRVGGFRIRTTLPRVLNVRRAVRTGVTVKPGRLRSPLITGPAWFDRVLREAFGLVPVDRMTRLNHDLGLDCPHLAAWDGDPLTAREAEALFSAYTRRTPGRRPFPTTENLARFVAALKKAFRGDETVWNWGSFRAAEGFVIIPVGKSRLDEVWPVAVRLARAHGIILYDLLADRVVRPRGRPARMLPAGT
jgi:hypothetical protein